MQVSRNNNLQRVSIYYLPISFRWSSSWRDNAINLS